MEALKRPARQYYRPELHAVRFLAFLLVFLHHAFNGDPRVPTYASLQGLAAIFFSAVNAFSFGLCLFFTLSAFLIAELLLREKQETGNINSGQFYIRRILRIWPLYYLALVLGTLSVFLLGGQPGSIINIGWFAIFMGSWLLVHHGPIPDLVDHLWSISVEEQFYLFAPWILKHLNRKSLFGFCIAVFLSADTWLFHLGRLRSDDDAIWCSSFVQFQCFAAGILVCLVLRGRLPQFNLVQRLMLIAGACVCWFVTCYELHYPFYSASENPGSWHLVEAYALISLGSAMVLVALLGAAPKLVPAWSVYLGRISFGLYVFHVAALRLVFGLFPYTGSHHFFLFFFRICLALVLDVLAAALCYRCFESPFLKLKQSHAIIANQPV